MALVVVQINRKCVSETKGRAEILFPVVSETVRGRYIVLVMLNLVARTVYVPRPRFAVADYLPIAQPH